MAGYLSSSSRRAGVVDSTGERIGDDDREILDTIQRASEAQDPWRERVRISRQHYDGTKGQHYWPMNDQGFPEQPRLPSAEWESQYAAPDIASTINQFAALNAEVPTKMYARPHSDTLDAREAASGTTRMLTGLRRTWRAPELRYDASQISMLDGELYGFPSYDWQSGRSGRRIVEGAEMVVPGGVSKLDESPWVCWERPEHVDAVRMRWPDPDDAQAGAVDSAITRKLRAAHRKMKELQPARSWLPAWAIEKLHDAGGLDRWTDDRELNCHVISRDYYRFPCPDYPNGCWRSYCNDTLIFEIDSLPYAGIGLKKVFYKLGCRTIPGVFRCVSVEQDVWPLLKTIEDLVNQIVEHQLMSMWGIIVADKSLGLTGRFVTEPAKIVVADLFSGTKDPLKFFRPDPMGPQAMQLVFYLTEKLNQLTGLNDPNRGIVNKSATLGEIEIAADAGRSIARTHYKRIDAWERDMDEACIVMEQAYSSPERIAQLIGRDRVAEQRAFMAARFIDDGSQERSVEIVAHSSPDLGDNAAVREERLYKRVTLGLTSTAEARDELNQVQTTDDITNNWTDNRRLLREMYERVKSGRPVQVNPWWNHEAMMQEVGSIVTQSEYLDMDPQVKAGVDRMFQQIELAAMKKAASQAAISGGVRPAPAQAGGGQPGASVEKRRKVLTAPQVPGSDMTHVARPRLGAGPGDPGERIAA